MIPIEELKQKPREHTLPTEGLLMIPIEELKLCYAWGVWVTAWAFDDTY